mmetsp:Transcript_119510/g.298068  ORF Transcript_119510/g.298068 Transcript_119510/m.298068 type:complete len:291 (-) Transcript_119510:1731-2603(-)
MIGAYISGAFAGSSAWCSSPPGFAMKFSTILMMAASSVNHFIISLRIAPQTLLTSCSKFSLAKKSPSVFSFGRFDLPLLLERSVFSPAWVPTPKNTRKLFSCIWYSSIMLFNNSSLSFSLRLFFWPACVNCRRSCSANTKSTSSSVLPAGFPAAELLALLVRAADWTGTVQSKMMASKDSGLSTSKSFECNLAHWPCFMKNLKSAVTLDDFGSKSMISLMWVCSYATLISYLMSCRIMAMKRCRTRLSLIEAKRRTITLMNIVGATLALIGCNEIVVVSTMLMCCASFAK